MSVFNSGYKRVWMVTLMLGVILDNYPVLDGPHPLWDLFTTSIGSRVELLGKGMVWDFHAKVAYLWLKDEGDARYVRDSWDNFMKWLQGGNTPVGKPEIKH